MTEPVNSAAALEPPNELCSAQGLPRSDLGQISLIRGAQLWSRCCAQTRIDMCPDRCRPSLPVIDKLVVTARPLADPLLLTTRPKGPLRVINRSAIYRKRVGDRRHRREAHFGSTKPFRNPQEEPQRTRHAEVEGSSPFIRFESKPCYCRAFVVSAETTRSPWQKRQRGEWTSARPPSLAHPRCSQEQQA
jgi:hypothetical protein